MVRDHDLLYVTPLRRSYEQFFRTFVTTDVTDREVREYKSGRRTFNNLARVVLIRTVHKLARVRDII